jgi:hypothetical protein
MKGFVVVCKHHNRNLKRRKKSRTVSGFVITVAITELFTANDCREDSPFALTRNTKQETSTTEKVRLT